MRGQPWKNACQPLHKCVPQGLKPAIILPIYAALKRPLFHVCASFFSRGNSWRSYGITAIDPFGPTTSTPPSGYALAALN